MFCPIGTQIDMVQSEASKNIIKVERFRNSDVESGIQDTTTSMHFSEFLK